MTSQTGPAARLFDVVPGRPRFRIASALLAVGLAASGCSGAAGTATVPPTAVLPATVSPATVLPTTASPAIAAPATVPPTVGPGPVQLGQRPIEVAVFDQARAWRTPTGVIAAVLQHGDGRVLVRTPCGGERWISGGEPVPPVAVVIDPGHGGEETGAIGPTGFEEKDLNLAIAELVIAELDRVGIAAALTRTADYRITLRSRAQIATAVEAGAFVSIHHNAAPGGEWPRPGSETYHQIADDESRRLAGLLYEDILDALDDFEAAWVADADAGAKYRPNSSGGDYYGILRNAAGVPAVLTEAAYLTNPTEEALLRRPEVQQAEARAIAQAIARFLTTDEPGSGFVEPLPRVAPAGPGGGSDNCVDPALE